MTTLEIIVLIVFILYLIFNIKTPSMIGQFIETPFGIVILLLLTLWMFLYTNPVLGILTIFVVYELVRRSYSGIIPHVISYDQAPRVAIIQNNPNPVKRKIEMEDMNKAIDVNPVTALPIDPTLEEEVVKQMAPLASGSNTGGFIETGFKPIAESTHNASSFVL